MLSSATVNAIDLLVALRSRGALHGLEAQHRRTLDRKRGFQPTNNDG